MNDIATLTDHASQQGDRWLFIFVFLFLLATFAIFFKWLLRDREAITRRLTDITDRHICQGEQLGKLVADNTAVIQRFLDETRNCPARK
jgi:hypothetical protein